MKAVKIIGILVGIYVLIVVAFESLLGYYQPENQTTMVITTTDGDGKPHPRVVARLELEDELFVAVNHWPRVWYWHLLENPNLTVTFEEETKSYKSVQLEGKEYDRVNSAHSLPAFFRVLTGFPPRHILRLDPV